MTERQEWLLLFLGVEGGKYAVDQIRVMKGMFLLDQTDGLATDAMYRFDPYDYGPFDAEVYRDLDALEVAGLIRAIRTLGSNRRTYELTEQGREAYESLAARKDPNSLRIVREVKSRVTSLGFEALLTHIYDEFPEYATHRRALVVSA